MFQLDRYEIALQFAVASYGGCFANSKEPLPADDDSLIDDAFGMADAFLRGMGERMLKIPVAPVSALRTPAQESRPARTLSHRIEPDPGEEVTNLIERLISYADATGVAHFGIHNGVELRIEPGGGRERLHSAYAKSEEAMLGPTSGGAS